MSRGRNALASLVVLALSAGTAVACGGDDVESGQSGDGNGGGSGGGEPVTVTDCNGVDSTFDASPERVVTLTSPVLEMLFWLGVEDTVIGTGSPPEPGDFPPEFDDEGQDVPKLAGEYESGAFEPVPREVLIGNSPDFVIGGFSSNFESEGAASQEDLADRDIPSYLTFSLSCSSALTGPQEDLDLTYRDLENLGNVFGVQDRADELIDQMRDEVDGVQEQLAGVEERPTVFAFEFDEGTEQPYATGNRQTINAVINQAGGRNIFDDLDTDYERVGWEEVVDRNPDVILIITYGEGDEQEDTAGVREAEEFLTSFEPIRNLDAVRNERFVNLLYEEGSAGGVRNAEAVRSLAEQLHPELGE
jgi:iron complex transport system substrate-binding protein